jgi:hypothetical protein
LDSSGRVISSSQRPLPDNTQHSHETDIHALVGLEPTIPASERLQTHALDRVATGISRYVFDRSYLTKPSVLFVRSIFWTTQFKFQYLTLSMVVEAL